MSLWGAFSISSLAMMGHAHHMGQIGTNVANVNTTAYKRVDTTFKTQLMERNQGFEFYSARPYDYRRVDTQGLLRATGRTFDVAISGSGMFVTNTQADGSGTTYFTRDGGFFGESVDLGSDSDGDGVSDEGTVLLTSTGNYVLGWEAADDGTITPGTDIGALVPIIINADEISPGSATSQVAIAANIPAAATTDQLVTFGVYDSEGNSRTASLVFTPDLDEPNIWTVDLQSIDALTVTSGSLPDIEFGGSGRLVVPAAPPTLDYTVTWPGGATASFTIDLRNLTQFDSETEVVVDTISQNGYPEGRLISTAFDRNGILQGSFSNGQVRGLYQLAIATFAAPERLEAISGNNFLVSDTSGEPTLYAMGSVQGLASLESGSLEQSNVDIGDQFTRMIQVQKAYSMSATVFRTADEMSQEAGGMKR